jgi:hypothetical protein
VDAFVGEGVAPGSGLDVEVDEVGRPAAWPEALTHEADGPLDETLFVATGDVAGASSKLSGTRIRRVHKWTRLEIVQGRAAARPSSAK